MRPSLQINLDTKNRVFGLDLLRATAVMMVVTLHGDQHILRKAFPRFPSMWVIDGVDLFFVLSGFLIGSILIKTFDQKNPTENDVKNFWRRRWFRTLPNYYLVLAICLALTILGSQSFEDFMVAGFNVDFLVFLQNFVTPHPNFFAVAWSLSVEEWFYFLFPLTVYALLRRFPDRHRLCFLVAIAIFISLPLCYRIYKTVTIPPGWDFGALRESMFRKTVITRLDTIAFGILGAYLSHYASETWKAAPNACFCLGVAILYVAQYLITSPAYLCTAFYSLTACGILLLLPKLSTLTQAPRWIAAPITYVSTISYSIYLLHFSVVLPLLYRCARPHSQKGIITSYIVYLAGTFVLSTLLYKYFERPITQMRDRKPTKKGARESQLIAQEGV